MFLTPERGKKIIGVLLMVVGLATAARLVDELFRAKSRTSITEAHVLSASVTGMGIGPLRHYGVNTRYEFLTNGVRFEREQLVDNLPSGAIYVRFDPGQPDNNDLALPDSSPQFMGAMSGLMLTFGIWLILNNWKRQPKDPAAAPRSDI